MSRLWPAPLMVSHANTVNPETVQFQRQDSCHFWTSVNFWSASPLSYSRKCSSLPDSDLKAPKTCPVPFQLPGNPKLVSTFSLPQEFVTYCFMQTANVHVTLQLMCKAAASHRKIQHRSCQCLSHTHCGFHWNPRAARTLHCASESGLTHPAATHRLLRSTEGAQPATALGSPQEGGRVWSICLLLRLNYYWYCSSDWWFSTTVV